MLIDNYEERISLKFGKIFGVLKSFREQTTHLSAYCRVCHLGGVPDITHRTAMRLLRRCERLQLDLRSERERENVIVMEGTGQYYPPTSILFTSNTKSFALTKMALLRKILYQNLSSYVPRSFITLLLFDFFLLR